MELTEASATAHELLMLQVSFIAAGASVVIPFPVHPPRNSKLLRGITRANSLELVFLLW
jgi:hypothetical protein